MLNRNWLEIGLFDVVFLLRPVGTGWEHMAVASEYTIIADCFHLAFGCNSTHARFFNVQCTHHPPNSYFLYCNGYCVDVRFFQKNCSSFLKSTGLPSIRSRGFNTNVFFLWDLLADYGGSLGIGMIKPALVQWCKSSFKCVTLRYSSNICITLVNLIENMFDDRWSMFNILALT